MTVQNARTDILLPPLLSQVRIQDAFWSPRLEANRACTLPALWQQLEKVGAAESYDLAVYAKRGVIIKKTHDVTPQMWWDSDIAKFIEAASASLLLHPDPQLDARMDKVIAQMETAQQDDGYLNTYFTAIEPDRKFTNERDWHELYNAGHLIEAAVTHYQATGKTSLLHILERYVDKLMTVYGPNEGQKQGYPGHEEIELALIRLYHATGKEKYLEFARYFLNERGKEPNFFELEARERGADPQDFWAKTYEYMQAHKPVREQDKVVGHAVRAMYLYAAMADLAATDDDAAMRQATENLWDDLTSHSLYIHGGLGPSAHNEGMTADYDLPNDTAYAETCAAVGLVFWARRMAAMTGEAKYADVMEQALYNNVLSGVSLGGDRFLYENPLETHGDHQRWEWHACPCCPPNLARLLASLGEYVYAVSEGQVNVNLYLGNTLNAKFSGQDVNLTQQTNYPWASEVNFSVETARPVAFTLRLRIPGWCQGATLKVNGQDTSLNEEKGYAVIQRKWHSGDTVTLNLPLIPQRVYAHPRVRQDAGKVALQRGPLVYCLEETDQPAELFRLSLPRSGQLSAHFEPDLLGGVSVIQAEGREDVDGSADLYRFVPPETKPVNLKAVPYPVWGNREATPMRIWIRESAVH